MRIQGGQPAEQCDRSRYPRLAGDSFASADNVFSLDLAKIIAGVLTGIGFLGVGAIIKQDDGAVVGTATGASIWGSGALGLTVGFGFYDMALVMFVLMALILLRGSWLSSRLSMRDRD